ncbi:MAG: GNAT family N-acetyltransferase [Acidobacteriota bacterium]
MNIIQTQRLTLRMFREADLDQYADICSDPEVMRYLGEGRALDRWEAWRQMAMVIGHWHLRGYGPWAVEERATGRLLGRLGFFNPEGWPGFELGWVLRRSEWGRGFATEGATAALGYAFDELKRSKVISLIQPANEPSIKVALRLGYSLEGRGEVLGKEVLIYGINAGTWRER